MNPVHFSSRSDDWATPQWLFDLLDAEFGFTLDVCATADNAKCRHYFSPEMDGLKQDWRGVCWMNPPYGRQISRFVEKAHQSALQGATVVCLLPARTDTTYWHRVIAHAAVIRFLKGRLKFGGAPNSAPFPSAVVVFQPGQHRKPQVRFVDLAEVQQNLFGC
jgi:phage N-6-adenine-methyltransferase